MRQVLADSIRWQRKAHELTQRDLSTLMVALGFKWTPTTVAKTEANDRTLAADELIGLALMLQCSLADLLLGAPDGISFGRARLDPTQVSDWISDSEATFRLGDEVLNPGEMSVQVWTLHGEVDPRLREWVRQEMSRWTEGRRLLRQPVTEAAERQHRSMLWMKLAHADDQELRDVLEELGEDTTELPEVPRMPQYPLSGRVES